MDFPEITFIGEKIGVNEIPFQLPVDFKKFLLETNGFIAFGGGFHFRGICLEPNWHSLQLVWTGKKALSNLFPAVLSDDIPFGQDCMGDQYLLRADGVIKLFGEMGVVKDLKMSFSDFVDELKHNPQALLGFSSLKNIEEQGIKLQPGQLLNAFPPFCMTQKGLKSSFKTVPVFDQIHFLSDFSRQIAEVPDGASVKVEVDGNKVKVIVIK